MITLKAGRVAIRLSPFFPLLCLLTFWAGGPIFAALTALILHELGHLLAARIVKIPVTAFELTPFGGVLSFDNLTAITRPKRFFLYLCGPLMNLLSVIIAAVMYQNNVIAYSLASQLTKLNFALLFVNLLPVLPLDGGQMLREILSAYFDEKKVTHALLLACKIIAAGLCGYSLSQAILGKYIVYPFFAGIYLINAAVREGKTLAADYVSRLIGRRLALQNGGPLAVQTLAARETEPLSALLPALSPQKYHIVHVLSNDGLSILGTLNEEKICSALLDRADQTLNEALSAG